MNFNRKWIYILTGFWLVCILSMCIWWLYIIFKMSEKFKQHNIPSIFEGNLEIMLKTEGFVLISLLLLLSLFIFYLLNRDFKKNRDLQSFFASVSHELKTPLASLRLQAEVIQDRLEKDLPNSQSMLSLSNRLLEDTSNLETQFNKILQLARIERDASISLSPIPIHRFFNDLVSFNKYTDMNIELNLEVEGNINLIADEFGLSTIFQNLLQNSTIHSEKPNQIKISVIDLGDFVQIEYLDRSSQFKGDVSLLGKMFYKYQSKKGSGIGLYLCQKITSKMNGEFKISTNTALNLVFKIKLPKEVS
jgi:signal transduction histidine kinase